MNNDTNKPIIEETENISETNCCDIKHSSALRNLYEENAVDDTIEHRIAFWRSQHPNGYSISHNLTEEMEINVMEMCWLVDNFPCDFDYY